MHVAYLINEYPKVSHSFIRREILALEKQGVEVTRIAIRGWDNVLVDPLDQAELSKTRYTLKGGLAGLFPAMVGFLSRHPRRFFKGLKLALSMSRNAVRPWPYHIVYLAHACKTMGWLKATNVSHVHAHFGTNSAEVAALVQALGGPGYSFTVHGAEVFDDPKHSALPQKIAPAKFVAASCAYIGSQTMYHIPPAFWEKIKVIHCGLPQTAFDDSETPLPPNPVFLNVGRFSEEKGHLILLQAFAAVLADHPDARLVLAGDGHMRDLIEAKITDLGIEHAVHITGWLTSEQVKVEIQKCQALVHPSFTEGLPVVIMEAMAQRRPVISTFIAGIPELVVAGKTGWLVPAGDIKSLATAMTNCAGTSPKKLRALGDEGFERVRARHDIDVGAAKLKILFEKEAGDESRD